MKRKGLREKKGEKAKEKHIGSRGKIKGASSVKGESKMHQGEHKE